MYVEGVHRTAFLAAHRERHALNHQLAPLKKGAVRHPLETSVEDLVHDVAPEADSQKDGAHAGRTSAFGFFDHGIDQAARDTHLVHGTSLLSHAALLFRRGNT